MTGKSPEFNEAQIASMSLHEITQELGTEGLEQRFHLEMAELDETAQVEVYKAYELAKELHKDDVRTTEPYINHLLRVCLRVKAHYGITDTDILVATLLHDGPEDHPSELSGIESDDVEYLKAAALAAIAYEFNTDTAIIVSGVTNPEFDPKEDKHKQYLEHLKQLVKEADPRSVVVKLSDFTDNATGILYTAGPRAGRLAAKYLPVVEVMRQGLQRTDLPLSDEVKEHIRAQLDSTEERCRELLAA